MPITTGPVGANISMQAAAMARDAAALTKMADRVLGAAKDNAQASAPPQPNPAAPQLASSPQILGSLQTLVALAALTPLEERRRMQVEQAKRGLDGLDKLHKGLLSGAVDPETLDTLAEWARTNKGHVTLDDDPKFAALFRDIELRVRVELAKFNMEI